jgi:hypothetical protein
MLHSSSLSDAWGKSYKETYKNSNDIIYNKDTIKDNNVKDTIIDNNTKETVIDNSCNTNTIKLIPESFSNNSENIHDISITHILKCSKCKNYIVNILSLDTNIESFSHTKEFNILGVTFSITKDVLKIILIVLILLIIYLISSICNSMNDNNQAYSRNIFMLPNNQTDLFKLLSNNNFT